MFNTPHVFHLIFCFLGDSSNSYWWVCLMRHHMKWRHFLCIRLSFTFLLQRFWLDRPTVNLPCECLSLQRNFPTSTPAFLHRRRLPLITHNLWHRTCAPRPPSCRRSPFFYVGSRCLHQKSGCLYRTFLLRRASVVHLSSLRLYWRDHFGQRLRGILPHSRGT